MPINPWLKEQIEKKGGSTLSVILEVPTSKLGYARNIISPIGDISSVSNIAGTSFITVSVDSSKISELSSIGTVHYNLPKGIKLCPLKQAKKSLIKIKDKFLGDVYISKVEIPTSLSRVIKDSISFKSENLIIIPSGKIVDKMKDIEESKSLSGRNVKLGVIDTGFVYGFTHPMMMYRYPELYTTIPEPPHDLQSHGCLIGSTKVYTSLYGIISLEDLWNSIDTPSESKHHVVCSGEYKSFKKDMSTIGRTGIVKTRGMYRIRSSKKVKITTGINDIELTSWHKVYCCVPKRSPSAGMHKRWYMGYEIKEKRADEIRHKDYILMPVYNQLSYSQSTEIDTKYAYLAGLVFGDGHIVDKEISSEIRIYDESGEFLEEVTKLINDGVVHKRNNTNAYELRLYGRNVYRTITQLLDPRYNDIEFMRAWIAGFFDAEGYVSNEKSEAILSQANKPLLDNLCTYFNMLGIPCTVRSGGISKNSQAWHLVFVTPEVFYEYVEPYIMKKKDQLKNCNKGEQIEQIKKIRHLDNHVMTNVTKTETIDCNEWFYDLADTDDNTYSANGHIVHNSWCTFMAGGSPFKHPVYGKMEGLAPNSDLVHIKALNSMGFGSAESTLKALEIAYNTGCKVVSMSLGGECQGGVDDDPEAKVIKSLSEKGMIIVSAAGNDGADWSINAPAFSPYCISVGSWGFTDDKLSTFSSRGPQSIWYKTHQDEYQKDLNKYGQDLIKPDVCAYGGQINNKEEVIMTGGVGWFAPYYHKAVDGFSCMHGSSQATPQVAGMIACLVENDMIRNQSDFKKLLSYTLKSSEHGYGLVTFSKLTVPTESENDLPLEHHYTV